MRSQPLQQPVTLSLTLPNARSLAHSLPRSLMVLLTRSLTDSAAFQCASYPAPARTGVQTPDAETPAPGRALESWLLEEQSDCLRCVSV